MPEEAKQTAVVPDQYGDSARLQLLGYPQVLARQLKAFSNFALSMSIICILAGGITSFHLGLCSVGGASVGLGWPLVGLFALAVAATMGQLASTFPTAGGLYHWAAILGGRGWGWITAWFNLAGLVTILAAVNVGTYRFAIGGLFPGALSPHFDFIAQSVFVGLITVSQAVINHVGIRATARLTDFSGYWIVFVAVVLTVCLLVYAPAIDPIRLVTIENFSGIAGGSVWPATDNLTLLFALGTLFPAYTITGFDASAHAAEETISAAENVPRAIFRSVLVSAVAGWVFLAVVVLAPLNLPAVAARGEGAFLSIMNEVLPRSFVLGFVAAIVLAQYLCGLAIVTSASRMAFAFARDGGLPFASAIAWVCPQRRSPVIAVWTVSLASVLFTIHTPLYATITAVCTIFLYLSYVLPTVLGAWAYGRSWTVMGPWDLGRLYRPLAMFSVAGCVVLIYIGMQPPNERSFWVVGTTTFVLALIWFSTARRHFPGPRQVAFDRPRHCS